MRIVKILVLKGRIAAAVLALLLAGCQTTPATSPAEGTAAADVQPAHSLAAPTPAMARQPIRIKAGADAALTDSQGVKWSADTGFDGGNVEDRPDLQITGTRTPELYRSERYAMASYSLKVPNGAYFLKLHFSEDFDGISAPAERMFTYAVKDGTASGKTVKEVRNFSPWKAAGAQFKAYVDTIPITVTTGQITITFTPEVENPQINALEIVPRNPS